MRVISGKHSWLPASRSFEPKDDAGTGVPFAETTLIEGHGNPIPDLLLFHQAGEQTRLIIDVCPTSGPTNDLLKVPRLSADSDCGICAGFGYTYRTGRWFRYRKGDGGPTTEPAFSDLHRLDRSRFP